MKISLLLQWCSFSPGSCSLLLCFFSTWREQSLPRFLFSLASPSLSCTSSYRCGPKEETTSRNQWITWIFLATSQGSFGQSTIRFTFSKSKRLIKARMSKLTQKLQSWWEIATHSATWWSLGLLLFCWGALTCFYCSKDQETFTQSSLSRSQSQNHFWSSSATFALLSLWPKTWLK